MTMPTGAHDRRSPLVLVLALALITRLAWWWLYVDVIENEGVEYTRLAANWFAGRGYVSVFGGTHTLFPPFYPFLIGLASFLTGSEEGAARLVSLLAGLATVGTIYALARRVFGPRAGALAGVLAACHPSLVALSVSTYSEGLYVGLSTGCALATLRAIEQRTASPGIAAGALAGFAYLTRPEGIALAAAMGGVVALSGCRARRWRQSLTQAALLLATAAVLALPYVAHLSRIAGSFRWEGKSAVNNLITLRQDRGMSYGEAARGVGQEGEPEGAFMFADQHALLAKETGNVGGLLSSFTEAPSARARSLASRILHAGFLGAPLLLGLVFAGVFLTRWWHTHPWAGVILLVVPGIAVAVLMGFRFTWDRFLFPILPASLIWAAAGTTGLAAWCDALVQRLGATSRSSRILTSLLTAALLLGVLVTAGRALPHVGDLTQTRWRDLRAAGRWIRDDFGSAGAPRRPRIAAMGLGPAHYAQGEVVYLPHAAEPQALRFLHRIHLDYLVLRDSEAGRLPYGKQWMAGVILDSCAQAVTDLPAEAAARIRIWRWTCQPEQLGGNARAGGVDYSRLPPP